MPISITIKHFRKKIKKISMETKGFRYLATEVFETITGFNPNFMKKLYLRQNKMVKSNQMIFLVNNHNSTTN